MSIEQSIQLILLSILERSITLIRNNASNIDAVRCEAYHVHNIPQMLRDFKVELIRYYWDIEREEYLKFAPKDFSSTHQQSWDVLAEIMTKIDKSNSGNP